MPDEDAAFLRLTFEEAAQNQAGWTLPLEDHRHPWHLLYERVRDSTGGLTLFAHMAYLEQMIERLECELAAEREKTAGTPLYIRPQRLETR